MTIEQLVPLANGLSLIACNQTLVLDGTRVTRFPDRSIEMAFRIAGTDLAPRFHLSGMRLATSSLDDIVGVVQSRGLERAGVPVGASTSALLLEQTFEERAGSALQFVAQRALHRSGDIDRYVRARQRAPDGGRHDDPTVLLCVAAKVRPRLRRQLRRQCHVGARVHAAARQVQHAAAVHVEIARGERQVVGRQGLAGEREGAGKAGRMRNPILAGAPRRAFRMRVPSSAPCPGAECCHR